MHQDYPFFLPGQTAQQAIRVQLAALLACLDGGKFYPLSETAPYRLPEKDDGRNVHSFTWIAPSGKLAEHLAEITASISRSILRKDIQPLLLVVDVDDNIDPFNTWLSASDFSRWCEQRTISLSEGELWERFLDEAYYIEAAAIQAAAGELETLESTGHEFAHQSKVAEQDWYGSLSPDIQEKISEQLTSDLHASLRELGYVGDDELLCTEPTRPLQQRERTTLLNIIGALLEVCGTKEAAVIGLMIEKYPAPGVTKRTLEQKFAAAKRNLRSS